jgi:hypothetical protein
MSTSRSEDRIVNLLSHWLARHVTTDELREGVEEIGRDDLDPAQAEAVEELRAELRDPEHAANLEMVVRETLEAVALGG